MSRPEPRPHPYVVEPYEAITTPIFTVGEPEQKLAGRLGFTTHIEPSAKEQLQAAMATAESTEAYLDWVWKQRPTAGTSSPDWRPYHHGETVPPLSEQATAPSQKVTSIKQPKRP